MQSFKKDYSKYYDLLYHKKNYVQESRLVKKIIKKYSKNPKNLLDIGCGTGMYSNLLSLKNNINVTGLDKSLYMINEAKKKKYKK